MNIYRNRLRSKRRLNKKEQTVNKVNFADNWVNETKDWFAEKERKENAVREFWYDSLDMPKKDNKEIESESLDVRTVVKLLLNKLLMLKPIEISDVLLTVFEKIMNELILNSKKQIESKSNVLDFEKAKIAIREGTTLPDLRYLYILNSMSWKKESWQGEILDIMLDRVFYLIDFSNLKL